MIDLAADAKPPSDQRLFGGLNPINCSIANENQKFARSFQRDFSQENRDDAFIGKYACASRYKYTTGQVFRRRTITTKHGTETRSFRAQVWSIEQLLYDPSD